MKLIKQNIKGLLLYLSKLGKLMILACPVPKRSFWFGALLFFVILGSLFPLYPAYAILGIFGGIADAIGKAIGWVIVAFLLAIPTAILGIASLLLGWSIDPFFITVPYTSGGVIDAGWPVVRDLANMGIVLVLVFIGLATALRLQEYQARRTLPLLIGVALLINFTPVILGVIVDAANIVMNFFLGGLTGGKIIASIFLNISSIISSDLGGFNFFNPIELLGFIFKILIIMSFMMFAAVIFLLFALLFVIRRVAIWILVILSPIAFVAYILPATRPFFRMWWTQFTQWTIIGVFAAFFLWLGDQMIGLAAGGGLTATATSDLPLIGPAVSSLLNDVLPYGIALIFLLIGFFVALSTSAMGAVGIVSGAQRGVKLAGRAVGAAGVSTARGVPAVSRAEARIRQRMERMPGISGLVGGPGAYAAELDRGRKRAGRNLEAMSADQIRDVMGRSPLTRDDRLRRARGLEILGERNRLEAGDQPHFQEAVTYGVSPRSMYGRMPNWAPAAEIRGHVERQETREFRRNIQPQAFETVDPNTGARTYTSQNLEVFYSMDMGKTTELGRTGNRQQKEALRNLTDQMEPQITARIAALRATGDPNDAREARKTEEMWTHIQGSSNYQT